MTPTFLRVAVIQHPRGPGNWPGQAQATGVAEVWRAPELPLWARQTWACHEGSLGGSLVVSGPSTGWIRMST